MLRTALEARIAKLLERAQLEVEPHERARLEAEPKVLEVPVAEPITSSALASLVEERIEASIAKLVLETQLRPAVRARPALAERWPLCISAAPAFSDSERILRHLGQIEFESRCTATEVELVTEAHGLIAAVEHEVSEDRRRAAMAIDAGHPHHSLVSGMRDLPKDGIRKRGAKAQLDVEQGFAQVLAPGCGSVQLHFPLEGLNETILETLRIWRGSKGLRHWAALQRLLSVEGGRSGRVQWKLDDHLEAVGYSERSRDALDVRRDIASEVELLTKMELAVYDRNGKLRLRQSLLTPITKAERQIEGTNTWALEGLILEVHPLLYDGVRDPKTGQIGTNWYPQTIELARIDDIRYPYAIALGLVLPIRWRWAWAQGQAYCTLSGANLLRAAGITYDRHRAGRAWLALQKSLDALKVIDALGHHEWTRDPETLGGICKLYPPQWAIDRTLHALPPLEAPPPKMPANGEELRAWRKAHGQTQHELAKRLGVSLRTVEATEAKPGSALGPSIRKNIGRLAIPRNP